MIVNEPCLVLNSAWQPVTFLPIGTAIATLMRDQAAVVHPETFEPLSFDEWLERAPADSRWIKTASTPVPAPELVVLKKYGQKPPLKVGFNRQNLFKRDANTCQYCGDALPSAQLQVEHVLPKSRGGPTTWENVVAACNDCNSVKADRTPEEAGMRLRKKPQKPSWQPSIRVPQAQIRDVWIPFLKGA